VRAFLLGGMSEDDCNGGGRMSNVCDTQHATAVVPTYSDTLVCGSLRVLLVRYCVQSYIAFNSCQSLASSQNR